jgi:myosin-crossreactive antigen
MPTRKTAIIAIITILGSAWLLANVTQMQAQTSDEQKQALIGEWKGVWPGHHGDSSTLIVHEIDDSNAKARCTYIVDQKDLGKSEHEVLADFFPGPNPQLKFRARNNDYTCVLHKDLLSISLVGSVRGVPKSNSTTMEKHPKK